MINGRFLTNSFGGARRFAVELAERLSRVRGDILLVTPKLPEGTPIPDVPHQVIGRLPGALWEQIELPLWLRRHGSPLLLNPATIAPFAYRRQISVIHDIAPAVRPGDFSLLFRIQWRLAVRLGMLREGQRMVTISATSQRELSELFGVDPERIEVVHAGADSLVAGDADPAAAWDPPAFLVFGRHGAAKNIRAVIDAAGMLPTQPPVVVRLIGDLDPALAPYAREKGVAADRLIWRGPVTDAELREEYRRSIAFLWPSLHEGFGIPPVEAQGLGVPVIASDIPINREILGDSALYFPATEPAELAERMVALAGDAALRSELGERGRENARKFTWDNTAEGWNALIRSYPA